MNRRNLDRDPDPDLDGYYEYLERYRAEKKEWDEFSKSFHGPPELESEDVQTWNAFWESFQGPPDLDLETELREPSRYERPTITELFDWPEDLICVYRGPYQYILVEDDDHVFRFIRKSRIDNEGETVRFYPDTEFDPVTLDELRRVAAVTERKFGYLIRIDPRAGREPFFGWPRRALQ